MLFEYQTTWDDKHPKNFLRGFEGYLCTDGYGGYNDMHGVINICCFAHARRKFDEALKALPKMDKNKPCTAQEGLGYCNFSTLTPFFQQHQSISLLKVLNYYKTVLK